MNPHKFHARRATLEDRERLVSLWQVMQLDAGALSRRMTEFQIVESENGELVGAVGLQIAGRQGLVHSESFVDFAYADHARPLLWNRIHALAANHGLLRIWTQEQAPFWSHSGMVRPDAETSRALPAEFQRSTKDWLTLKLRDDIDALLTADKEFALFMEAEKRRTQRVLKRAAAIKYVVAFLAFCLLLAVIGAAFHILRRSPHLRFPGP